jgi:hypothetical protein
MKTIYGYLATDAFLYSCFYLVQAKYDIAQTLVSLFYLLTAIYLMMRYNSTKKYIQGMGSTNTICTLSLFYTIYPCR